MEASNQFPIDPANEITTVSPLDQPAERVHVRWSKEENRLVPDDNPLVPDVPEGQEVVLTRYARVVNGVAIEVTDFPTDPNLWFVGLEGTWYPTNDPTVMSWWLYNENTQLFTPPPPITDPPLTGGSSTSLETASVEEMVRVIKDNPSLRDQLRAALQI